MGTQCVIGAAMTVASLAGLEEKNQRHIRRLLRNTYIRCWTVQSQN